MGRTVTEIKAEMTAQFMANETVLNLYELEAGKNFEEQFSVVSMESILFYIFAFCAWTLEQLFDTHKSEVTGIIENMKPHSLRWYANKSKAFQNGYDLPADSDTYDNTGLSAGQVEDSKIVDYAAAMEVETGVRIRVAKTENDDLAPLSASELQSFREYMSRIKDAGVRLSIDSNTADLLYLSLKIYYNPLVLEPSPDGKLNRIDGTATDVVTMAVKAYLRNLPFNGILVLAYLTDALQQVDGIVIPHVSSAKAQYAGVVTPFDVKYAPNAGYIRLDDSSFFVTHFVQTVI